MDFYENRDTKKYGVYEEGAFQHCLVKVFGWLFIGLLISAGFSYATANYWVEYLTTANYWVEYLTTGAIFASCFIEIILVIILSARVTKISYITAGVSFIVYSAINGFSLAGVFLVYNLGSIVTAFMLSATFFGLMALYGITTKKDLSGLGTIFFISLVAILVVSILNIFIGSSGFDLLISYLGVAVFAALTAFDVQKIKTMYEIGGANVSNNIAIYGALSLYLDFINIFIKVLRILGKKND